MAVQLSAPGVYVVEVPSGARTITGVGTSVTAFLGRALRGPTDKPVLIGSWADFERAFGGLWADSELTHAVRQFFLNGGSQALIVRVAHETGAGTLAAAASAALTGASGSLQLEARSAGDWGENLRATVSHGDVIDVVTGSQFHLTITEVDPVVEAIDGFDAAVLKTEEHRFVSSDPTDSRYILSVLEERSRLARVTAGSTVNRPDPTTPREDFSGGEDGDAPDDTEVQTAVGLLDLADLVNLVCIPPYASDGSSVPEGTWTTALSWCEPNRAMLMVDPDDSWVDAPAAAAVTNLTGLRSKNAVYLFPRVLSADPLKDGLLREFVPSGAVAGVFARTDAARGVWKAPAGLEATLRGVSDFTMSEVPINLTETNIGTLNSRGVNCLVPRGAAGPVIWGSRTARGADTMASEWKYVPVRRVAHFIEESLYRGLQWVVFEPNDEPLWGQIRVSVGTFMDNLFRQGAFQGSKASDAYRVQCDSSTTTQTDIDNGIVNIKVAFAPLKPAEFVVLSFQQMTGQAGT